VGLSGNSVLAAPSGQAGKQNGPSVEPQPKTNANGKIAFTRKFSGVDSEIFTMNPDGSGQTNITNLPTAIDTSPAWSPDGSRIAFVSDRDGNNDIYVMNANGSGVVRLTSTSAYESTPSWSPDGTKIAYHRSDSIIQPQYEIYVMNANGSSQTRLTNYIYQDVGASWSPDGTRLVFSRENSYRDFELFTMNADGTNPNRLPTMTYGGPPKWSPDGSKFLYVKDSTQQIFVCNTDGSGQTQLTTTSATHASPSWSPDGTRITWNRDLDMASPAEIWVMNADGSAPTRLTAPAVDDWSPDWGSLAASPSTTTATRTPSVTASRTATRTTTPAPTGTVASTTTPQSTATVTTIMSTDVPKAIPDNGQTTSTLNNNTAELKIDAATVAGTIADVDLVGLNIPHTWLGDLQVTLTSPSGTSVVLINRVCSSDSNFSNITLDDSASTLIGMACPPASGASYRPSNPLVLFTGQPASGTWTLTVRDMALQDIGSLTAWGLRFTTVGGSTCTIQFSDVQPGSTFYPFVQCLACSGVLGGYSDGTFRPGNNVTRGQLSKIVSNAAGYNDQPTGQSFSDVPPDSPYYLFIERLVSRGIIGGYSDGTFRPNNNATRGQIAKIVSNAYFPNCQTP
jgi:subtilisin-like proprotein convertase family protein